MRESGNGNALANRGIMLAVRAGLLTLLVGQFATSQTAKISTFAGSGHWGYGGETGAALAVEISYPFDVDVDGQDNVYFMDGGRGLVAQIQSTDVFKISQSGQVSKVFTLKDLGLFANTDAAGLAISPAGDVAYVAAPAWVYGDHVLRLDSKGQTTLGSNYTFHLSLGGNSGIRIRNGLIYVTDTVGNRIVRIGTDNSATVIGGTGTSGYGGDGGAATTARFNAPNALAIDTSGNIFVADSSNHCIREISASGTVSTIAGICTQSGFSGDAGQATAAKLSGPSGVAVGPDGTVYISDTGNHRIRRVNTNGTIETVAGTGKLSSCFDDSFSPNCFSGDGGNAAVARLNTPLGMAFDSQGRLYFADSLNHRIRMLVLPPAQPAGAPLITSNGIVNAASFAAPVARGGWATIYGTNFTSGPARIWNSSDFSGNNLPTSLDGVSVTFNDKPAAVYYFNANQINVQVPDGLTDDLVTVKVTTPKGSAVSGVQHRAIAPGLFTITQVKATDGTLYYYPAAVHLDGTLVGRPNVLPGSRPVVGGEIILVFGTGFGPSNPPQPSGMLIPSTLLNSLVTFTLNGSRDLPQAAALISPGLYQFNVLVPAGLKSGVDYSFQVGFLGGSQSQQGVYLPIN